MDEFHDDSSSGSSLCSLLTNDVLRNIPQCFRRLERRVKVKLLRAFLHLPLRVSKETTAEMSKIVEIGSQDEDEGVRFLSEILSPVFLEVTQEVKKTDGMSPENEPMETGETQEEAAIATYKPRVEPSPMEVDNEDQGIDINPASGSVEGGYPCNITMPKELIKEEKLVVLEFVGEGIVFAEKLSVSDMFSAPAVPASRRRKPGLVQVKVSTVGGHLLGGTNFQYTLPFPTEIMVAI